MMRIWFVIFKISENLWQRFLPLEAEATGSSFTAASDLGVVCGAVEEFLSCCSWGFLSIKKIKVHKSYCLTLTLTELVNKSN